MPIKHITRKLYKTVEDVYDIHPFDTIWNRIRHRFIVCVARPGETIAAEIPYMNDSTLVT